MIDLVTRIQSMPLYERMLESAKDNASGELNFFSEMDIEGMPYCAKTYNAMSQKGKSEIIGFVEDDVEFLSKDWDRYVQDIFLEYAPDILGVVGSTVYNGGGYFDAGNDYSEGLIGGNYQGQTHVRIFGKKKRFAPVKVIDGMLMFVSRSFFEKESFDEKNFDELFYYDIDLCLRAPIVGVTSEILIKHSKPPELYGKYPAAMKPVSYYDPILEKKHGLIRQRSGNQMCCMVALPTFEKDGQTECYRRFKEKWLAPVSAL